MSHVSVQVRIRGGDLKQRGMIDTFEKLTVVKRYNAGGSWTLEINAADSKAHLLDPAQNAGAGVTITRNGQILTSGPVHHFSATRSSTGTREGALTVNGPDDTGLLERWLTWPVPANAIASQGATYFYNLSGASTPLETLMHTLVNANCGPGARTARRMFGLSMGTNLGRGTNTAYRGSWRFEPLIEALAEIAQAAPSAIGRGGLGFKIVPVGAGLEFQVYETASRVNVAKFSAALGNVTEESYAVDAPTKTMVVLGTGRVAAFTNGPEVATTLTAYERIDDLFAATYAEAYSDAGDIDPAAADATQRLDEAAELEYDTGAGQVSLRVVPTATESVEFMSEWDVGDYVTATSKYLTTQQQVREVTLTYDHPTHEHITALIGTAEGVYRRRTGSAARKVVEIKKKVRRRERWS